MTCLKEPGHVNDSCICEDGRNNKCYPRLLSSAVDDMYDNCDDKTCNVWQVFTSNVRPHVSICVVYMYTDVSEAVDPCQELKSRRFRSPVSLVPSRDDTTCHSLCSISSVDKPQDRNSSVKIEWNFVDKSDRNQVEYRVMNNITRDSKPWTSMSKYYHRKKEFSLTNRNLEIRFNLTDMTSIRRLRISVEYDADIMQETESHPETISDEPDKLSAGCRDAPGPPAGPTMQTSRSQYAQVEGEQNNKFNKWILNKRERVTMNRWSLNDQE
ncbi:hypothetical protein C0Q70_11899 [Pomacea canaliculata]|uniref:Uncharacterized protein n=1 Tax=Pomacea canaliculata TaxID=400727 RepID=A0A2T7P7A2_POMCA|nr:hypothetical protein C0Q70_11899 [Pomacea canaliculata]